MKIKNFSVDLDDLDSIVRAINQLKSAAGCLRPVSKNKDYKRKFEAANAIWDCDISSIYESVRLSDERKFYVYAHCDSSKPIRAGAHPVSTFLASLGAEFNPFYIGKGAGDRALNMNRNGLHRKVKQRIQDSGHRVVPVIMRDGLTELEALMLESKLIDIIGVSGKSGRLSNHDEGIFVERRRSFYANELAILSNYHAHMPRMSDDRIAA